MQHSIHTAHMAQADDASKLVAPTIVDSGKQSANFERTGEYPNSCLQPEAGLGHSSGNLGPLAFEGIKGGKLCFRELDADGVRQLAECHRPKVRGLPFRR